MLTSKVAKRYAQGLLDFAQESGQTETVFSEMKDIVKIMTESKELSRYFTTPFIDYRKKTATAEEIFKDFSPVSQNIIKLIIRQGREKHLKDIAQDFIIKVEDLRGVQRMTLTSATPLSQKNIDDILKSTNIVKTTSFDLKTIIDPEILGGYILRVGDYQIDASVKAKLTKVKKEFQLI